MQAPTAVSHRQHDGGSSGSRYYQPQLQTKEWQRQLPSRQPTGAPERIEMCFMDLAGLTSSISVAVSTSLSLQT